MQGRPVSSATPLIGCALLTLFLIAGTFLTAALSYFFCKEEPATQTPDASPQPALPTSPPRHPAKTDRPEFPNAGAYVRHELKSIIIPVVDFEDTSIEEAIDFFRQRSRELSSEPPERAGFGMVVRHSRTQSGDGMIDAELDAEAGLGVFDPRRTTLTLKAENTSLYDLLQHVCRQADLQLEIEPEGLIVISPASEPTADIAPPPSPDPNDPFTGSTDPVPESPEPFVPSP